MPTLLSPRIQNVHHVRHRYGAGWRSPDFRRTSDMADFGPPVEASDPRADTPLPKGAPKPVNYLPVPRKADGKPPLLTINIGLSEEGKIRAVRVPAWDGAKVQIEVGNLWDPTAPKKVEIEGTLQGLVCKLDVTDDMLRGWLDFTKPLGAGVNENLLDFKFRIPRIVEGKEVFAGESQDRLFLYRRKVLVFFPGVFGSQVQFTTPEGQQIGFPDFFCDDLASSRHHHAYESVQQRLAEETARGVDTAIRLKMPVGKLGALECDDAGKPLMQSNPPTILMAKGQVYDPFDRLHAASRKRFAQLPEGLRLNTLFVSPYDWRGDILETVRKRLDELRKLCDGEFVKRAPDTDDQVALIGHSTGGLVARGILASKGADALVSHAFFQNVPFRGAAKTLPVMATGRDPLDGKSMIPIIDPHSLRAVALTSPIVYLLSANQHFKHPVFVCTRGGVPDPKYGLEAERAWVELAIATGFMPWKKAIPAGAPLSPDQRRAIALRADAWNAYWGEYCERRRGRTLIEWLYSEAGPDDWPARELTKRALVDQDALRVEEGWNQALAQAADAFHDDCERWASKSPLVDRCFIFYSVAKDPTTVRTDATLVAQQELPMKEFLDAVRVSVADTRGQVVHPPIKAIDLRGQPLTEKERKGEEPVEQGAWLVERWYPAEGTRFGHRLFGRQVWRFATRRQIAGDGTVPLASQIGFGGNAKVFKRIVDDAAKGTGPDHVNASNHPWVWDRIVETIQGHDMSKHLAKHDTADPRDGIDHDRDGRLKERRVDYALEVAKQRA